MKEHDSHKLYSSEKAERMEVPCGSSGIPALRDTLRPEIADFREARPFPSIDRWAR